MVGRQFYRLRYVEPTQEKAGFVALHFYEQTGWQTKKQHTLSFDVQFHERISKRRERAAEAESVLLERFVDVLTEGGYKEPDPNTGEFRFIEVTNLSPVPETMEV